MIAASGRVFGIYALWRALVGRPLRGRRRPPSVSDMHVMSLNPLQITFTIPISGSLASLLHRVGDTQMMMYRLQEGTRGC